VRRLAPLALGVTVLAAAAAGAGSVLAHSASQGLHLHLSPDAAVRGSDVAVTVNAAESIVSLAIGFVGVEPKRLELKPPRRDVTVSLRVPADATGGAINVQAEAKAVSGKTLRASAILKLLPRDGGGGEGGTAPGERR